MSAYNSFSIYVFAHIQESLPLVEWDGERVSGSTLWVAQCVCVCVIPSPFLVDSCRWVVSHEAWFIANGFGEFQLLT